MTKKGRAGDESTRKKDALRNESFELLKARFDNIDPQIVKSHILILIAATILVKLAVVFLTTMVFHSFVDYFDIGVYWNSVTPILQGQYPYIHYQLEYPILTIVPILLAFIPAVLTQNILVFVLSFQALMIVCDILIVLCVYFIGLKIYNEKTAFCGGLIYATAFSSAYFIITKSDAFSTCLLMLGLLFTVYGFGNRGYCCAVAGFFTKMFPAIALPFMVFYNAKKASLTQEIGIAGKIFLFFCVILLLPLAIISPATISTYLFATGGATGVYVNTATYTIYAYLSGILHTGITAGTVSTLMYVLMGISLLLLFAVAFTTRTMKDRTLLKLTLCAVFCLVFFTKFHSPQYIVWFTPLLALLAADDLIKICLFYASQILAYIEFPLMFGNWYTNVTYTQPVGSTGWYMTLLFFTIEYFVLIALLYHTVRPKSGFIIKIKELFPSGIKDK